MEEITGFYLLTLLVPIGLVILAIRLFKNREQWFQNSLVFTVIWNIHLLFTLLLIVFAIGESWYRFGVDTTDSFGLNMITTRWGKRHYVNNNFHFRDNIDWPKQTSNGKRRISFIGDSFTAGHGVANVDDRFGNIVRKLHPDWEVHVLGKNGMETDDFRFILERMAHDAKYEIQEVVYVYNLNDIASLMPQTAQLYQRLQNLEKDMGFLSRQSYLVNTWYFRLKASQYPEIRAYFDYVLSAYSDEVWPKQVQQLAGMAAFCRQNGWKFKVVTFPFLHTSGEGYQFRKAHQKLDELWAQLNVPHLDLLPIIDQHAGENLVVNAYDAHPNERAHAVAADAINTFLEKR